MSHGTRKDKLVKILPNPRAMRDSVCVDLPFSHELSPKVVLDSFTTGPQEGINIPLDVNNEAIGLSSKLPSVDEDPLVGSLTLDRLKIVRPNNLQLLCQYL